MIIPHVGAVLKDLMLYPAPDGIAADLAGAGDAVPEGNFQRIVLQGTEPIADAPPIVAAQDNTAVLDDRTAVGAAIALRQHRIRALSDVMLGHIVRLVQGDVAVVHDGMGLVAHHVEDDLAAVRPNGASAPSAHR